MRPKQFTLETVAALPGARLVLRYADDQTYVLDLSDTIAAQPNFARLSSPVVFESVRLDEHGAAVIWDNDDDLTMAADNLRARAVEQGGGISHEFIWNWMHQHQMTLDDAASALGLSRRMLAYYRSGAKPVPRTVALACLGWEAAQRSGSLQLAQAA